MDIKDIVVNEEYVYCIEDEHIIVSCVAVDYKQNKAVIESEGEYRIVDPETLEEIEYCITPNGIMTLILHDHGIEITLEESTTIFEEWVEAMKKHGYLKTPAEEY